jgi:hypothetical protein
VTHARSALTPPSERCPIVKVSAFVIRQGSIYLSIKSVQKMRSVCRGRQPLRRENPGSLHRCRLWPVLTLRNRFVHAEARDGHHLRAGPAGLRRRYCWQPSSAVQHQHPSPWNADQAGKEEAEERLPHSPGLHSRLRRALPHSWLKKPLQPCRGHHQRWKPSHKSHRPTHHPRLLQCAAPLRLEHRWES